MGAETTPPTAQTQDGGYQDIVASVARGGLWSIGWQALGLLAALIATPFTIRLLGRPGYGVWALLQTALTWVALADVGMAIVSTRFAGDRFAQGDDVGEATAVWTATTITVVSTTIACAALVWFAPVIVADGFHVHGHLRGLAVVALRIMAVAIIATVINNTFNTPQTIRLQWFKNTLTTTGAGVLQVILVPVVLWLTGGGVETTAIVATATALLGAAGTVWVALSLQPRLRRPRFSKPLARSMLNYGAAASLSGFATIVLTSAERLLLGHYAGVATVAVYAVATRLANLLSAVPLAAAAPLLPALVRFHSAGRADEARVLYARALQGTFLIVTPAIFLVGCIARPFLTVWAGSVYGAHSTHLVYIILAGVWFSSLTYMPQVYLFATEFAWLTARVRMLEVVPYLVAAALLTSNFGATGAAIVWSARNAVDALILFPVAAKAGRLTMSPLSSRRLMSALAPLVLAAGALASAALTTTLAARVGLATLLLVVYSFGVWWVVLEASERASIKSLAASANPLTRSASSD